MNYAFLIVIVVVFGGMMWWQSRKTKQQQNEVKNFRESLEPGTEVITIGGMIGKVVSVDTKYEEIVIDSEGSLTRFTFRAISKAYTRPAYVDDSEVDENGNPLPQADVQTNADEAQVPFDEISASPADTDETSTPQLEDAGESETQSTVSSTEQPSTEQPAETGGATSEPVSQGKTK